MMAMCGHIRKNGYPLRIGVVCDKFQFALPPHDFSLSAARLTIGAPVYTPYLVEINVHSPVSIVFAGRICALSRWRNLVIETEPYWKTNKTFKLMAEGIEISAVAPSLEEKKFQKALRLQTTDKKMMQESENQTSFGNADNTIVHPLDKKITAEFVRLDLKREKGNLLGHVTFDGIDSSAFIKPHFADFPKIDGNLKWILNDVPDLFNVNDRDNWKQRLYGKSGVLKRGEVIFHTGGALRVSGPFSFDDKGYLTAKFELSFAQPAELLSTIQHLFPMQASTFQALFFVLGSMPKNADSQPYLPLLITHGVVKLGFFKLGHLAPL
ncbi:DUF2125 domain-containing protein [Bartonella sp. B17]